jgi:hypothetical protein
LPRSRGRRTLESVDDAAIVLPNAQQLLPTFARWHSAVPTVGRGPLEELMEAQVDGIPYNDGLRTRGHHRTLPCLSEFSPLATRYIVPSEKCKLTGAICMNA